jgi:HTH-type transcriptional regulator / antitoxin HigA
MIPTSNSLTYGDLLLQYQPKLIDNSQEYERLLSVIEGMMSQELTDDEGTLFDLMVLLIEEYERKYDPIARTTPSATLESLLDEFDVDSESLIDIFGDQETVESVIAGKRAINLTQAQSLAGFFNHLSPKLAVSSRDFLY